MDNYDKGPVLGQGTFGKVFQATHKKTGEVVAIKTIKLGDTKEGINVTALREIKLLKELHHENIIRLVDAFPHKKNNLALVFDYAVGDLEGIIKDSVVVLPLSTVKAYMQMILRGLAECHKRWVVHRDIKPNNCLVAPNGMLKLADFGLARLFGSPDVRYTNQVFARWYRPPELFFGSVLYNFSIDIWATGCVFAELLLRRPWFPGDTDIDQLARVFAVLGTPNEQDWPGVTQLPSYLQFSEVRAQPLNTFFKNATSDALDLLSKMVQLNPAKRISAENALRHPFFTNMPAPTPLEHLPTPKPSRMPAAKREPPALDAPDVPAVKRRTSKSASGASSAELLSKASPRPR